MADKQMDLFDEGGLMQEGGQVDEVSGNDVPTGSLKEEVRDDIPAQLSEGEFVMPADVVRYHGLDKMMALRDEAKMGLARMEAMGQMGNSEEATIPDGIPFNMEDLEIEDDEGPMEMQVGGYIPNQQQQQQPYQQIQQQPYQQPYGIVQQPAGYGINMQQSQFADYAQQIQPASQFQPFGVVPQPGMGGVGGYTPSYFNVPAGTGSQPGYTFGDLMPTIGGTSETREYRNEAGESLYIPFINGEPIYPIPEGYTEYTPEDVAPVEPDQGTTQPTQGEGGGRGDGDDLSTTMSQNELTAKTMTTLGFAPATEVDHAKAYGGHTKFGIGNPALRSATFDQARYQLASINPTSSIASALAKEFGFLDASMYDMSVAGNKAKMAALSTMGKVSNSQLTSDIQATMVGKVMSAAHAARKAGLDVSKAIENEIAKPEHQAAIRAGAQSAMKDLGFNPAEVNNPAAVEAAAAMYGDIARNLDKDIAAATKAGMVTSTDPVTGAKKGVQTKTGVVMTASALAKVNAMKAEQNKAIAAAKAIAVQDPRAQAAIAVGNVERGIGVTGTPTAGDIAAAKDAAAAATAADAKAGKDYGDEFGNIPDDDSSDSSPGMGNTGTDTSGEESTGGEPSGGTDGSDNDGPGADDGPGTYICTASYANGIIPRDHFTSLKKYGIMLRRNDPYLMKAYDLFGPKLAAKVKDTGWTATLANLATAYYKARYTNTLSTKQKIYDRVTQTLVWPTLRLMGWVLTKVSK